MDAFKYIFCDCSEYLGEKNCNTGVIELEDNIKYVVKNSITSCNCPYCNKINYIK